MVQPADVSHRRRNFTFYLRVKTEKMLWIGAAHGLVPGRADDIVNVLSLVIELIIDKDQALVLMCELFVAFLLAWNSGPKCTDHGIHFENVFHGVLKEIL